MKSPRFQNGRSIYDLPNLPLAKLLLSYYLFNTVLKQVKDLFEILKRNKMLA